MLERWWTSICRSSAPLPNDFDEYERQVREEYAWVPDPVFRQVRKGILEEFVARPAIFSTAAMRIVSSRAHGATSPARSNRSRIESHTSAALC